MIPGSISRSAVMEATGNSYPWLALYIKTGSVRTKGEPTRSVPVNSSSEYRNMSRALEMIPGMARRSGTFTNVRRREAPRLMDASSRLMGIDLKTAVIVQTP